MQIFSRLYVCRVNMIMENKNFAGLQLARVMHVRRVVI